MTEQLEYVGDTKFPSFNVSQRFTEEEWRQRAQGEYRLTCFAANVLDMDDKQLEAYARTLGTTDEESCHAFMDLADWIGEWRQRYLDSTEAMDAVTARMVIVAERLAGREHMEETYREG